MTVKMKYVGIGTDDIEAGHCTLYEEYSIISIHPNGTEVIGVIVDDNGDLYVTHALNQPLWWELVHARQITQEQIYP